MAYKGDTSEDAAQETSLAGPEFLVAAAALAEWCEEKRREAIADARRQFRIVWALLAGGVLLLLVLPRLVAFVDYTAATLPPDAVREAEAALSAIESNEREMIAELETAEADLAEVRAEVADLVAQREALRAEINAALSDPLSAWTHLLDSTIGNANLEIHAFARASDNALVGVGFEGLLQPISARILRSEDGVEWRPAQILGDLPVPKPATRLFAIGAAPDAGIFAGGFEGSEDDPRVLLLRSADDGQTFRRVGPEDMRGRISSIMPAPGGGILAAGETNGHALALLSRDGIGWQQTLGQADAPPIAGEMLAMAYAPGSEDSVIAAGWTRDSDEAEFIRPLFLRTGNGDDWAKVAARLPDGHNNGIVEVLSSVQGFGLIAAGAGGDSSRWSPLIVSTNDIRKWKLHRRKTTDAPPVAKYEIDPLTGEPVVGGIAPNSGEPPPTDGRWSALLALGDVQVLAGGWTKIEENPLVRVPSIMRVDREGSEKLLQFMRVAAIREKAAGLLIPLEVRWAGLKNPFGTESQQIRALVRGPNGSIIISVSSYGMNSDMLLRQATPEERDDIATQLTNAGLEELASADKFFNSLVLADVAISGIRLAELRARLATLTELENQQARVAATARSTRERQAAAKANMSAAARNLEDALRLAEPMRQASWIATRLAVVALIIFLVQIVVNRYRYFQRLADFREARGRTFRLLADMGPETASALIRDMTLNDLTAGLSTEGIGFGKSSEPPTGPMFTAMAAALKK